MNQPLETVSVVDAATNRIRDNLFSGQYAAGQELKDTQIAKELGIARPTARIAVQQLVTEGMLIRQPGFSARVRTFDPSQVRDIFRVRRVIELDAIREIRRTGASLDLIEASLRSFSDLRDGDSWSRIAEADVDFHSSVVTTAGSPHFIQYFAGIANEIRLLIALFEAEYEGVSAIYEEHVEIFDLLRDADDDATVEAAWASHLDISQESLEEHVA